MVGCEKYHPEQMKIVSPGELASYSPLGVQMRDIQMGKMPKPSWAALRERERRAIELHLGGWTLERIANELGYANASGPQKAIARAMERHIAADVAEQELLILLAWTRWWRRSGPRLPQVS